jgi:YD repeat-containing protein
MTPNSNSALSTTVSYNTMWAAASVVNPNGATATTTYDNWGRPSQSTIPVERKRAIPTATIQA